MNPDLLLQGLHLYSLDTPTWISCSYLRSYSSRTRGFMFPLVSSVWKWQHLTLSCQNPKPAPRRTEILPPPSSPTMHQAPDPQAPIPISALPASRNHRSRPWQLSWNAACHGSPSHPSLSAKILHTWLPQSKPMMPDENILNLIVVMVAQLCECTKNHRIIHFKRVNYMVCELYPDKAVIFKKPSDASDFHIP